MKRNYEIDVQILIVFHPTYLSPCNLVIYRRIQGTWVHIEPGTFVFFTVMLHLKYEWPAQMERFHRPLTIRGTRLGRKDYVNAKRKDLTMYTEM
jgi:hypothetical protein